MTRQERKKLSRRLMSPETIAALMKICKIHQPGEWIPCTEAPPEDGTEVLVTREVISKSGAMDPVRFVQVMFFINGGWDTEMDPIDGDFELQEPLAWMPKPRPWKGDNIVYRD